MPHDPVLLAETRAWLAKAQSDLRAAEHGFQATPPLLDDVVFHCQQAAEKTMEGFLTWHGCPFRKTHSLEEIWLRMGPWRVRKVKVLSIGRCHPITSSTD